MSDAQRINLRLEAFPAGRKAYKAAFQRLHTSGHFCIPKGVQEATLERLEANAASKKGSSGYLL
jgi:hypothetical protein